MRLDKCCKIYIGHIIKLCSKIMFYNMDLAGKQIKQEQNSSFINLVGKTGGKVLVWVVHFDIFRKSIKKNTAMRNTRLPCLTDF